MAQEIGAAYVTLLPSAKGFGRAVEGEMSGAYGASEKQGRGFFSRLGGMAKGFGLVVAGAVGVVAGLAAKGGISRALNIEDAQAKLKGLGHDVGSVEAIMTDALAAVKGTAFGLDSAATIAASAVAAGIEPGKELEQYLRLTADAATIAGISMEEMGSIMNKVNANGRAMTENLNQLQDRGIPILQWLAEEYGVTTEAMSKMVSDGKVDAETFNRVLQENIGGAALASGETTRGAFANMMAALSRLGEVFLGDGLGSARIFFGEMITLIDGVSDRVRPWAERMNGWMQDAFPVEGLGERALAGLDRFIGFWTDGAGADLLTTLAPAAGLMKNLGGRILDTLAPAMEELGKALAPVLPMLSEALVDAVIELAPSLTDLLVALIPLVPLLAELAAEVLPTLVDGLAEAVPMVSDLLVLLTDMVELDLDSLRLAFDWLKGDISTEDARTEMFLLWEQMGLLGEMAYVVNGAIFGFVLGALQMFQNLRTGAGEIIAGLQEAWGGFGLFLGEILAVVVGIVTGDTTLIGDAVARFTDRIRGLMSGARDAVVGIVTDLWGQTVGRFVSGAAQAIGPVEQLPGRIRGVFAGAASWLLEAGQNIMIGLILGIRAKIAEAVETIRSAASRVVTGAKDFLGIKSPSRVFRDEVGKMIGAGLIEGIDSMSAQVDASVSGLVAPPSLVGASAPGPSEMMGNLYLDSGEFLGVVRGQIGAADRESSRLVRAGRQVR